MDHGERVETLLSRARELATNPERKTLIEDAVNRREALPLSSGTLATWTSPESTGRSPKDTYIVKRPGSEDKID